MKHFPSTIRQKFYLLITVVCLIPIIIITIYSLRAFSRQVYTATYSSIVQICQSVDYNIELTLNDIKDASSAILASNEIQSDIENGTLSKWQLSKSIINLTTNKRFIASTIITLPSESVYSRTNTSASTYGEKYAHANMSDFENFIFENVEIKDPNIWKTWIDGQDFYIPDNNCVFFSRSVNNLSTLKKVGDMIIGVDKQLFSTICSNELSDSDFSIYIVCDDHVIFSTEENVKLEQFLIKQPDPDVQNHKLDNSNYLIYSSSNSTTGWRIYCTLPYKYLYSSQRNVIFFTLLLGTITLVSSLFAAYAITHQITKQIYLLTNAIDNLGQQDFSKIQFNLNDEIGRLGNHFQTVVAENYALTTSLYETTIKHKEAELQMLQSQINPHFLYNTLNNLYWMTKKAQANDAAKMVLNLSQFFELALNHGNPTTTVEKEIKLIQCYFEIQNVRFNNRFDMIIDIPDELMKYEIQNIILQPLVENSIHHGLEMLETKGIIQVTGIYKDDYLIISVQDNGIGFPPDCNPLKSEGYALYNINERLHLTYGKKSGLSIQSTSETGTVVTVKMYKPTPTYKALS